ncbi:MAG: sulfite exporter TauE/SafE family protein [Planctomycetota bacterium]|jgi:uncharacterized membrane protein YfcA
MDIEQVALLAVAFAFIAAIYSTVGHGGASGYLMVMGVVGISPELMKPTALSLNLVVAATGMILFARAGGFRGRTLWPFLITSIPAAFIGGAARLDPTVYRSLVAVVLWFAAFRLALRVPGRDSAESVKTVPVPAGLLWGAAIGLLSGLVGVGGGIFLSPLLMLAGWATAKQTAGVSAAFILANSAAGLGGIAVRQHGLAVEPGPLAIFAATVLVGGFVGSAIGSRRFGYMGLRRALAVVLAIAGLKMMFLSPPAPPPETPPAVRPGA